MFCRYRTKFITTCNVYSEIEAFLTYLSAQSSSKFLVVDCNYDDQKVFIGSMNVNNKTKVKLISFQMCSFLTAAWAVLQDRSLTLCLRTWSMVIAVTSDNSNDCSIVLLDPHEPIIVIIVTL